MIKINQQNTVLELALQIANEFGFSVIKFLSINNR